MLWPIVGSASDWPAYRKEQAHIDAGESPAWDLGDREALTIVAPWHGVVKESASDPHVDDGRFHAGNITILQIDYNGVAYEIHFCHQQALECLQGAQLDRGDVIGHVGHTGPGLTGSGQKIPLADAHLHLWVRKSMNGLWQRVWPSELFG